MIKDTTMMSDNRYQQSTYGQDPYSSSYGMSSGYDSGDGGSYDGGYGGSYDGLAEL